MELILEAPVSEKHPEDLQDALLDRPNMDFH